MALIPCFDHSTELKEEFKKLLNGRDLSESEQKEIGKKLAIDYHKDLHNQLNTLRGKMGVKPVDYHEPLPPEKIEQAPKPPTEEKSQTEGEKGEPDVTSIKNSITEEKIKAAGLTQPVNDAVRTFGDVWQEAKSKIDNGYDPRDLVKELQENPSRPLTDLEDAVLTYHNATKEAELIEANKKINEAYAKGEIPDLSSKAKILDELQQIYNVDKQAGAANARGLNMRKLMVDRKYSLANMIAEKQASENFGEPLSKEQQAEVEKQFEDIKAKNKALQDYNDKLLADNAKLKAEQSYTKTKSETRTNTKKSKDDFARERKDIIDNIKKKWDESKGQLSATIIPYADRLVKIAPDVAKLLRSYAEEGIDKLSDVVSKIQNDFKDAIPEVTEKDIHDIIAGEYNRKATRSELSRKINDLKTEASLRNKLEALQNNKNVKTSRDKLVRNKQITELKEKIKALNNTDEANNARANARIQKNIDELNKRIKNGDYSPPIRNIVAPDKEGLRLKAEYEKAKDVFDQGIKRNELKNRSPWDKVLNWFVRGERAFKLSNPITLGKLAAAAATRMATAPIEEGVGGIYTAILPKSITSKATGEAGFNVKSLAKGYTESFMQGLKEAGETAAGTKTNLEAVFGKKGVLPPDALDFFGQLHSALKAPVKRFAFERSFAKRMVNNIKNGVNVEDPAVATRISIEAYKDAQRAIFMQDNYVSSGWNTMVRTLENSKNKGANTLAASMQWLVPFVKVPTNIVAETAQHAFGAPVALGKIMKGMLTDGLKDLSQEDAESIMRSLKKGSIGAIALTLGYLNPKTFGGYYQDKEKRAAGDVRYGDVKIAGVNIPAWLLEAPIFQTMQLGSTVRRLQEGMMGKKPMGLGNAAISGAFGLLEHEPLLDEPARIAGAIKDPEERKYFGAELARSTVAPAIMDYAAKISDPADKRSMFDRFMEPINQRKPSNDYPEAIIQHIQSSVPILNQQLPLKSDKADKKTAKPQWGVGSEDQSQK